METDLLNEATLIIVDDESLARYSTSVMLSRNFDDVRMVAEAENGRQAVVLARELRPDIIIMDVKMPGMNGVEAARQILNEAPETAILLASAHDSFRYAQQAIEIGVYGYILKPIQEEEFVQKIRGILEARAARAAKSAWTGREYPAELMSFIEEEFIAVLLGDNGDAQMMDQFRTLLEIARNGAAFYLIRSENLTSDDVDRIESLLKKTVRAFSSRRAGPELAFYIPVEDRAHFEGAILPRLEEFGQKIERLHGDRIYTQASSYFDADENAAEVFSECYRLLTGRNDGEAKSDGEQSLRLDGYPFEGEEAFIEALQLADDDNLRLRGEELCSSLENAASPSDARQWAVTMISSVEKTLLGTMRGQTDSGFEDVLSQILAQDSVLGIRNRLSVYFEEVYGVSGTVPEHGKFWLERAIAFLKKNMYSDISVEVIADHIGISSQHLARIFKEQFGRTVGEYILQQRMTYAKYLLSSTQLPIGEISEKTGYTDQNYFARVFKKHTAMTPSSFRDRIGVQGNQQGN